MTYGNAKLPLVVVYSQSSLQQALMLTIGIDSVQTQNKLIPWHCSVSTPSPQRLLHSTKTKRKQAKGGEQQEEEYKETVILICWSHSQVILAIQKGNRNRTKRERCWNAKLKSGLGLFWPWRNMIFLYYNQNHWLFLLRSWPNKLEELQQFWPNSKLTTTRSAILQKALAYTRTW